MYVDEKLYKLKLEVLCWICYTLTFRITMMLNPKGWTLLWKPKWSVWVTTELNPLHMVYLFIFWISYSIRSSTCFLGCIATFALTIILKYDVLQYLHSPFFVIHIVLWFHYCVDVWVGANFSLIVLHIAVYPMTSHTAPSKLY